jgi:hypothetical protein
MITFEDWKAAIEKGVSVFYIVDTVGRRYETFYCLGATDYVFDKDGGTYLCLGRKAPRDIKAPAVFFKAEDCFFEKKDAERQLAWYLDNNVFQAIKLTYEETK